MSKLLVEKIAKEFSVKWGSKFDAFNYCDSMSKNSTPSHLLPISQRGTEKDVEYWYRIMNELEK